MTSRWLARSAVAVGLALRPASPVAVSPPGELTVPVETPAPAAWIDAYNWWRQAVGVSPVIDEPIWSDGNRRHARYSALNDRAGHDEDPLLPGWTPEGAAAAATSNLIVGTPLDYSDKQFIERWIHTPFHGGAMLDPYLERVGFGSAREPSVNRSAAGLDVVRGRNNRRFGSVAALPGSVPGTPSDPSPNEGASVTAGASTTAATSASPSLPPLVLFPPRDGVMTQWRFVGNERPDPIASCPGYTENVGTPIFALFPSTLRVPATATLRRDGAPVELCVFDGSNYNNPNAQTQRDARGNLTRRNEVVVVPREPYRPGSRYEVTITAGAQNAQWGFVAAPARPLRPAQIGVAVESPGRVVVRSSPPPFDGGRQLLRAHVVLRSSTSNSIVLDQRVDVAASSGVTASFAAPPPGSYRVAVSFENEVGEGAALEVSFQLADVPVSTQPAVPTSLRPAASSIGVRNGTITHVTKPKPKPRSKGAVRPQGSNKAVARAP